MSDVLHNLYKCLATWATRFSISPVWAREYFGTPPDAETCLGQSQRTAPLRHADEKGLVQVRFSRVMEMRGMHRPDDAAIKKGLETARVDPAVTPCPRWRPILQPGAAAGGGQISGGKPIHRRQRHSVFTAGHPGLFGALFPDEIIYAGRPRSCTPLHDPGQPPGPGGAPGIIVIR
jgi:hypothetical protein